MTYEVLLLRWDFINNIKSHLTGFIFTQTFFNSIGYTETNNIKLMEYEQYACIENAKLSR